MSQRIGPDGKPAEDVIVNPKAVERKAREAAEKARLEEEAKAPWSRERIETALESVRSKDPIGEVNGQVIAEQLNLHGADLSGLDLSGLNLSGANLHGAKLLGADLTGTSLAGANLSQADLSEAILKGCDLSSANLSESCICDADATEASFRKANLADACIEGAKGLDIRVVPLTFAEMRVAAASDGVVNIDDGIVLYKGDLTEDANIAGLTDKHED